MSEQTLTGGCLCGGVRYEVQGELFFPGYCHCSLCRRWTGAAASAVVGALGETFRLTEGDDVVRAFRWEDRKDWVSCSQCGSSLFTIRQWPPTPDSRINIRLGTLDDAGAELAPQFRIYVSSKAQWDTITDELPQFENGWGDG